MASWHISNQHLERLNGLLLIGVYAAIFVSSYVFFKEPFEFYIGYLIMILLFPFLISKKGVPKFALYISLVLLLIGIYNILIGNNTLALFLKVYIGLIASYLFYYYIIEIFKNDLDLLFKLYLKGAFIMSLIAFFQLISFLLGYEQGYTFFEIFNKIAFVKGGALGLRLNGIYPEPSQLAIVQAPAVFYSIYTLVFQKEKYFYPKTKAFLNIFIYLFSFSSLAYIGLFVIIILILLNKGLIRSLFISVPIIVGLFYLLYNNVPEFRERFDSSTDLFETGEYTLGKTNGSSVILYDNFVVAFENFKSNILFGTGIGSHPIAFKKYSITKKIRNYGFDANSKDANSMFLRLLSETGLFGILLLIFIIFNFYVSNNNHSNSDWVYSNSLLVLILLGLFRQGHYFINGFPFFVFLYIQFGIRNIKYKTLK